MKVPITQSKMWHTLQSDLKERSFFVHEKTYHYLAILKTTPVGKYLYLPYGPLAETQKGMNEAISDLKKLAEAYKAFFIRIEPQNTKLKLPKHAKKSHDLNPKETWILDLTGNDEDLKGRLPSRLLRYYNGAAKKGITIETSHDPDDIHYLLDLQKALAKEKGINTFSEDYLKTELKQLFATLYLLKYNREAAATTDPAKDAAKNPTENSETSESHSGEVIAAGLVFDDEDTRYNLQGAQSEQGRSLHATGILTIKLILDAKEKGLRTFDFWGIAPENAPKNHPWAGFTAFKKTFEGEEVKYHGTHDIILKPAKYKSYQLLRKIRRMV